MIVEVLTNIQQYNKKKKTTITSSTEKSTRRKRITSNILNKIYEDNTRGSVSIALAEIITREWQEYYHREIPWNKIKYLKQEMIFLSAECILPN